MKWELLNDKEVLQRMTIDEIFAFAEGLDEMEEN